MATMKNTVICYAFGSLAAMKMVYVELMFDPSKTFDASSCPPDILFTNLDSTRVSEYFNIGIRNATIHCRYPGSAWKRIEIPSLRMIKVR